LCVSVSENIPLMIVNFGFWRQYFSNWIRIRIPKPDQGDKLNADPCGSGSVTLIITNVIRYRFCYVFQSITMRSDNGSNVVGAITIN
jgi:hypothetical protein